MNTNTEIMILVGLLAIAGLAILLFRRRTTERLQSKFGPEYSRTVDEAGGRTKAAAVLQQREKRVQAFTIKALTPTERERFVQEWRGVQTQFVDDPKSAVISADQLLGVVMGTRGYPVGDFEQQSADLSVDHPLVVQNYRTAHAIAVRDAKGQAGTEDLRQAMLSYRALFDELVSDAAPARLSA
jgi:LPXTG-motif cell wall-anchored protein